MARRAPRASSARPCSQSNAFRRAPAAQRRRAGPLANRARRVGAGALRGAADSQLEEERRCPQTRVERAEFERCGMSWTCLSQFLLFAGSIGSRFRICVQSLVVGATEPSSFAAQMCESLRAFSPGRCKQDQTCTPPYTLPCAAASVLSGSPSLRRVLASVHAKHSRTPANPLRGALARCATGTHHSSGRDGMPRTS